MTTLMRDGSSNSFVLAQQAQQTGRNARHNAGAIDGGASELAKLAAGASGVLASVSERLRNPSVSKYFPDCF